MKMPSNLRLSNGRIPFSNVFLLICCVCVCVRVSINFFLCWHFLCHLIGCFGDDMNYNHQHYNNKPVESNTVGFDGRGEQPKANKNQQHASNTKPLFNKQCLLNHINHSFRALLFPSMSQIINGRNRKQMDSMNSVFFCKESYKRAKS